MSEVPSVGMQPSFSQIYAENVWDVNLRSGPGSDPKLNRRYGRLIEQFIRSHNVRSVVDLGCGDWSFSRTIDWTGVDYVGIDVVPELIAHLNNTYARPGVRFIQRDILGQDDLPSADLAISKDVLQHWPIASIQAFIGRLELFRHALITNDCKVLVRNWRRLWIPEERVPANIDIEPGEYRPVRLTEAPFHLAARRLALIKMHIAKFPDPTRRPEDEYKEVLVWSNPRARTATTE